MICYVDVREGFCNFVSKSETKRKNNEYSACQMRFGEIFILTSYKGNNEIKFSPRSAKIFLQINCRHFVSSNKRFNLIDFHAN